MMQRSEGPALLDSIPGEFSAHAWHNLLIACWPRPSAVPGVRMLGEVRSRYLAAHPEGASLIHISADASVPDEETSAAWVDMMKRYSDRIHCIGVVIPARGFGASVVRSWVTEKRMIAAPGSFTMRFHATVDELMEWLPAEHQKRTGVRLPSSLVYHLRQLVDATCGSGDSHT